MASAMNACLFCLTDGNDSGTQRARYRASAGVAGKPTQIDLCPQGRRAAPCRTEIATLDWHEPARVLGYYSIRPGSIEFARVPAKLTKKLGRYDVPVFRLRRLAIDRSVQGQGLGGDLLLAAGERALAVSAEVGGVALAIDAKDEKAARWYERFGALALLDDPLKLILPLGIIATAIATAAKRR